MAKKSLVANGTTVGLGGQTNQKHRETSAPTTVLGQLPQALARQQGTALKPLRLCRAHEKEPASSAELWEVAGMYVTFQVLWFAGCGQQHMQKEAQAPTRARALQLGGNAFSSVLTREHPLGLCGHEYTPNPHQHCSGRHVARFALLTSAKCCADDYDNVRHIAIIKETIFTKVLRSYFRYISSKQLANIRALIFLQASKVRAALLARLIHSASSALNVSRYICTPDKTRVGKSEPTA